MGKERRLGEINSPEAHRKAGAGAAPFLQVLSCHPLIQQRGLRGCDGGHTSVATNIHLLAMF